MLSRRRTLRMGSIVATIAVAGCVPGGEGEGGEGEEGGEEEDGGEEEE